MGGHMQELIFGIIGGTALLMYGVNMMGEGLQKASGEMMKKMLSAFTSKAWGAFLVGIFLTTLVQSSTAITVLTVGFVNAGLMKLSQAVSIIYGANIGTTITAQLMAFNFKFKLTEIALPILGLGFAISHSAKKKTVIGAGNALMGFGIMFLGLKILNQGIPIMQESETLALFFENYASIPIIGILLGMVVTALVHSSAATVGLVMVLGQAGLIALKAAICIMLGNNIGTCLAAQLASLTGTINARRTAWAHTIFNSVGVVIVALFLPYFVIAVEKITLFLQPGGDMGIQIANSHVLFNLITALLFLPNTKLYVKFLETVIKPKDLDRESHTVYLDKLLLDTPAAAFQASISEIIRGAELGRSMVFNVMEILFNNDEKNFDLIYKDEDTLNLLQRDITRYMIEITKRPLSDAGSVKVPAMINSINNIERIGDHTIDIARLIKTKDEKDLIFSESAMDEIKQLKEMVLLMYDNTIVTLKENKIDLVQFTSELEDEVDEMCKQLERSHIKRLEEGECSIESGKVFLDIVNHFERIADHINKVSLLSKDEFQGILRANGKMPSGLEA